MERAEIVKSPAPKCNDRLEARDKNQAARDLKSLLCNQPHCPGVVAAQAEYAESDEAGGASLARLQTRSGHRGQRRGGLLACRIVCGTMRIRRHVKRRRLGGPNRAFDQALTH